MVSPEGSEVDKSSPDTRKTSAASTNIAFHDSGVFQQPFTSSIANTNNSKVYLNAATVDETSTDDFLETKKSEAEEVDASGSQPIVPPRPSKDITSSCSSSSNSSHSSRHSSPLKKVSTLESKNEDERNIAIDNKTSNEDAKQHLTEDDDHKESTLEDKDQEESSLSSQHWGPERTVDVVRVPGHGLGISIVGGKIDPLPRKGAKQGASTTAVTGIFIKNVLEGSPAGATGELCTGDRILEVDGHDLRKASHEKAVEIIRQSGDVVVFVVQSLLAYDDDDEDEDDELEEEIVKRDIGNAESADLAQTKIEDDANLDHLHSTVDSIPPVPPPGFENEYSDHASNHSGYSDPSNLPPPPPPPMMEEMDGNLNWRMDEKVPISDDSEVEDDESDETNFTGQITLPNGTVIDRGSAAFLRRSKKDREIEDDYGYTKMKVLRKYAKDSPETRNLNLVSLNKGTNGLGISLAGHKDRSQMAIYVCGLNPLGNASRVGGIGKLFLFVFQSVKLYNLTVIDTSSI